MKPTDLLLARCHTVFPAADVEDAVTAVADALNVRCAGTEPVVMPVLLGALPFVGALLPKLRFALEVDAMQVSRYRGSTKGDAFEWLMKPKTELAGRAVVVLDDVLEDGHTLAGIVRWLRERGAVDVITAVLVRKASAIRDIEADIVGLEAGREFLIGYGMDYRGRYRNLPDIRALPGEMLDE